jgi:hypothetical protein
MQKARLRKQAGLFYVGTSNAEKQKAPPQGRA